MEMMQSMMDFWNAHSVAILASLLGMSEALALIPGVQSNSIFQLMVNVLKKMAGK